MNHFVVDANQRSTALQVSTHASGFSAELQRIRRHLHRFPELSEHEHETTRFLAGEVSQMDLVAELANDQRGLWVDIGSGDRCVAIRGDIDALPIQEDFDRGYCSEIEGVMHACGHDAHATTALGAGMIIKRMDALGQLPHPTRVRVLLQPAEETSTGGLHMIRSGALDGVDAAVSLHVDPTRSAGQIGVRSGSFTAGCQLFRVTFDGRSGHSSRPHLTDDCIAALAAWINQAYIRVPRCHDVLEPMVLSVGQVSGGNAANVIPRHAELRGTLRAVTDSAMASALGCLEKLNRSIEQTHGCKIVWQVEQSAPALINDAAVTELIQRSGIELLGSQNVLPIANPSMGAEDFAFIAEKVPAAMFRLGIAGAQIGSAPLHTPQFDIDESALPIGAAVLAAAAIACCDPNVDLPSPSSS
ncbi:amidohydrolase [Stieleria varia]|uniref:Putative hydrolase YxeP n=1 Tax=Stieleria varia TaxID=2528005 RepID=A0A5C6AU42_9BACT|nr:amidohydrolase [Stieleria varia]TWU02997.1 putative hydrolase YxeP [Stieleria varia]